VTPQTIHVALGARSYDVLAAPGLLQRAGDAILPFAKSRRVFVVTDTNVHARYAQALTACLTAAGVAPIYFTLAPGEGAKSFPVLARLCDDLLAAGVERGDLVLAFGGGVIGDLAGFAAGILKRGVDFVQIPTTLLAQVDSSVGGKTAINAAAGKNMIGLFNQPRLVLADTAVLDTLPRREMLAGFAEVAKYGLLGDAAFFAWLEAHGAAVLDHSGPERLYAITTSIAAKARIVAEDEREAGMRALLNLGHTFGHALEAETGYGERLLHGESVAIGMIMAFELSERLGHCAPGAAARIAAFFKRIGLPASPRDVPGLNASPETMVAHMTHDKKNKDGRITLILARGIGQSFVTSDTPVAAIRDQWARAL
jgi:3-dehydroquinate synthase